jgi:DNA polymerase
MASTTSDASGYVPDSGSLDRLRSAAAECRGCDLYRDATQTVFGRGKQTSSIMIVGEQPGDEEDRAGEAFVGPAGRLLDRALEKAGIDSDEIYVTNAVKHFRFVPAERGKRRIHKTPSRTQIVACRPWLLAELAAVRPDLVIFLGATAAKSLLGPSFRVSTQRGHLIELPEEMLPEGIADRSPLALATVHPASVLRAPDRDSAFAAFLNDLQVAAGAAHGNPRANR